MRGPGAAWINARTNPGTTPQMRSGYRKAPAPRAGAERGRGDGGQNAVSQRSRTFAVSSAVRMYAGSVNTPSLIARYMRWTPSISSSAGLPSNCIVAMITGLSRSVCIACLALKWDWSGPKTGHQGSPS